MAAHSSGWVTNLRPERKLSGKPEQAETQVWIVTAQSGGSQVAEDLSIGLPLRCPHLASPETWQRSPEGQQQARAPLSQQGAVLCRSDVGESLLFSLLFKKKKTLQKMLSISILLPRNVQLLFHFKVFIKSNIFSDFKMKMPVWAMFRRMEESFAHMPELLKCVCVGGGGIMNQLWVERQG